MCAAAAARSARGALISGIYHALFDEAEMSRSSVAFVSSTADRCGARQATGSLAATVNFPPHDGGLYSQLKVSALLHSGKVAFQCLNRSVITHTYSELLADVNKVR